MRCTALTALFFALFALFSTMAYAAPLPQGVIIKRQDQSCNWSCRDATGTGTPATPASSNDHFAVLSNIIIELISLMGGSTDKTTPPTLVTTSSSSSAAAPAADPTGMPQSVPTIKWFTEIAIPSPTPGIP